MLWDVALTLGQWFSPEGDFVPLRTFCNVWRHFELSQMGVGVTGISWVEQLNILQCTTFTTKDYLLKVSGVQRMRSPALEFGLTLIRGSSVVITEMHTRSSPPSPALPLTFSFCSQVLSSCPLLGLPESCSGLPKTRLHPRPHGTCPHPLLADLPSSTLPHNSIHCSSPTLNSAQLHQTTTVSLGLLSAFRKVFLGKHAGQQMPYLPGKCFPSFRGHDSALHPARKQLPHSFCSLLFWWWGAGK